MVRIDDMIKDNPLIERIRGVRHQISEEYHHDPKQLVEHYIELEKKHQGRFIELAEIYRKQPGNSEMAIDEKNTPI
jgi:hypothetical protein